jgi:transcriptional regulator with XRE-family HTH domain
MSKLNQTTSGISHFDSLIKNLYVGDNVIWYDDAGSLAWVFSYNFIKDAQKTGRPLIYVSFDRSPKNLLKKLGNLAEDPQLVILDCFTWGKGSGSEVFLKFYDDLPARMEGKLIALHDPASQEAFNRTLYDLHAKLQKGVSGEVRFVFESLTGMQEIWGGEEELLRFYVRACPRLYELNTVAYWIMEKDAHSQRTKATINQTAQVVIDLAIRRGTTRLTMLKAENREPHLLHKPQAYWTKGESVQFHHEGRNSRPLELGPKIRELRTKNGLSQSELARLIGVTASSISQIESNLIHPSLPALVRLAEVLGVGPGHFFQPGPEALRMVHPGSEASVVQLSELPKDSLKARLMVPHDFSGRAEPYVIEIPPGGGLPRHFFLHRGEEIGYLLQGGLEMKVQGVTHQARAGDLIYLTTQIPSEWRNPGDETAKLFWAKLA